MLFKCILLITLFIIAPSASYSSDNVDNERSSSKAAQCERATKSGDLHLLTAADVPQFLEVRDEVNTQRDYRVSPSAIKQVLIARGLSDVLAEKVSLLAPADFENLARKKSTLAVEERPKPISAPLWNEFISYLGKTSARKSALLSLSRVAAPVAEFFEIAKRLRSFYDEKALTPNQLWNLIAFVGFLPAVLPQIEDYEFATPRRQELADLGLFLNQMVLSGLLSNEYRYLAARGILCHALTATGKEHSVQLSRLGNMIGRFNERFAPHMPNEDSARFADIFRATKLALGSDEAKASDLFVRGRSAVSNNKALHDLLHYHAILLVLTNGSERLPPLFVLKDAKTVIDQELEPSSLTGDKKKAYEGALEVLRLYNNYVEGASAELDSL